jgi:hypothetical protein
MLRYILGGIDILVGLGEEELDGLIWGVEVCTLPLSPLKWLLGV